jgi:hypothetical protein
VRARLPCPGLAHLAKLPARLRCHFVGGNVLQVLLLIPASLQLFHSQHGLFATSRLQRVFREELYITTPLRPQPPRSAPTPRGLVSQQFTKLAETERASGQSQPLSAAKAQTLVLGLLKRAMSYVISRQTSVRFPKSNFICSAASEAGRPGDRCCLVLGHK